MLPFDFGTRPAADAGIPGLNLDTTFTSGLFGGFIEGDRGFNLGSGLGVNRCNCPLDQDEKQFQVVGNVDQAEGEPQRQGRDRRAARLQPSRAERSPSLGRTDLPPQSHVAGRRAADWGSPPS